jgi:ribonuclease HI
MKNIIIYTDGGSRGNPGKAAIGVVIFEEGGLPREALAKWGEYLGDGLTNNEAEYRAVLAAFKKLREIVNPAETEVEVRSDSELLVNQMSGRYKIKNENIRSFVVSINRLMEGFANVSYVAIPREQNKEADKLVNEALDKVA